MGSEEKEVRNLQAEKVSEKAKAIEDVISNLGKYGNFSIIATTIDGAQDMDPDDKATLNTFLRDDDNKDARAALKKRLLLMQDLLTSTGGVVELTEKVQDKAKEDQELLNKNINKALDATKEIERAYREVKYFFDNSEQEKLTNFYILNTPREMLTNLDNDTYSSHVENELKQYYDRLDLRENYSMMVIPGYLGSKMAVDAWAKIAYKHKAMLITDFKNLNRPEAVIEQAKKADIAAPDVHLANAIMTCNWLVGRGKHQEVGEEEDLHVPGSSALAGLMYRLPISQVGAGFKYYLQKVEGVRMDIKKTTIGQIDNENIIPMIYEFNKVTSFSDKTLFNGDNIGLQTYSVVRVFDYVAKVLMHYLNQMAFQNFDFDAEQEMKKAIKKFLNSICCPKKLIEKFKILKFHQDPDKKNSILLDIYMVPYFPGKTFLIKLDGHKGLDPDSAEWQAEYSGQKA